LIGRSLQLWTLLLLVALLAVACAEATPTPTSTPSAETVWPSLQTLEPATAAPGQEVRVIGSGGFLQLDAGYDESSRDFPLFLDGNPIGVVNCFVNRCEGVFTVPLSIAPGVHEVSVDGGSRLPLEVDGVAVEFGSPPSNDPFDLARRYRGVIADPLSTADLYPEAAVGTEEIFWVIDLLSLENYQVSAELRHVGLRAQWYVAADIAGRVEQGALERVAARFDQEAYPLVVDTIAGGRDLDGPVTILIADIAGLLGYFSSADQYPTAVQPFSNERVMLFMAASGPIESDRFIGTLAHELQHVFQQALDSDEVTWVNEGLSEFASRVGGYPFTPVSPYLLRPDTPLIYWPLAPQQSIPSYGAASLFISYLAERTSHQNIQDFVAEQGNGIDGVQAYLDKVFPGLSFNQFFADWAVANLVGASAGPYASQDGRVSVTERIRGTTVLEGRVSQYAARYISVESSSPLELRFNGATQTPLLPVEPHSGDACWWSNRGDDIDTTLTRTVDLTDVSEATLRFWHWHELEELWDYGYVAVSADGGDRWHALEGRRSVTDDPLGTAWGPGFTGVTNGWVEERVDLSSYVGSEVLLRFEHVADESTSGAGWCIDDISIEEVGFLDDAESNGDWQAAGFLRVPGNRVAQDFAVRWVTGIGDNAVVTEVPLDGNNSGSITVMNSGVLVVIATAPKTSVPAEFTLEVR
jgi:immune inhibitor A